MTDVYLQPGDSARSDAELILEVRGGDLDAYGALYERHAIAARSVARQYSRSSADADDLVSEAFHRVLTTLQHGGGPDATFRAYLLTVVRRLAGDLAKGVQRTRPTSDEAALDAALEAVASTEFPALANFEKSVVRNAYEALPERWQAVLWYTEIEGRTPAEIAPILGLTPNGVAALAYRAREGLRVGYLQQHLTAAPSDTCRGINPLLGAYVRGGLARREVGKVDAHLDDCGECRALVLELSDVAHGMRAVVAPLVVGLAGLAVVGALPLGGALAGGLTWAGAGAGAGAAAGGTAAGGAAVGGAMTGAGAAGAGAAGVGAGAGAAAGAGASASASVAAAAGATVATGTAATAGTAAGAAVAVATGTVAAGGATVAAAAGAVAVATVGVVTVLSAMSTTPPLEPAPVPTVITGSPWEMTPDDITGAVKKADDDPAADADAPAPVVPAAEMPSGGVPPADVPSDVDPDNDPLLPTNLLGTSPATFVDPAVLDLVPVSVDALQPRVAQNVTVSVANSGGTAATDTFVDVALPAGLRLAVTTTPSGASAPTPGGATLAATDDLGVSTAGPEVSTVTQDSMRCSTIDESAGRVRCSLGTIEPGEARTGYFRVVAQGGGSFPLDAQVWADNVASRALALPPTVVLPYGAELTASAGDTVAVANPGVAWVPVTVVNTGDQSAGTSWSARITAPAGLRPVGADGDLACAPVEGRVLVWSCAPTATASPLGAGESRTARVRVVANGETAAGSARLTVEPVLPGSDHVKDGGSFVAVASSWAGAQAGSRGAQAVCASEGGVASAAAVVKGTYVNTTAQSVALTLSAAGSEASANVIAPGESATVQVPDGMRVPAGGGTWTLRTTVADETYSTTVPAGSFGAVDCYAPSWEVDTSVDPVNVGGRVQVRGTLTNRTDEQMQVRMVAAGGESERTKVGAGETTTLVVDTGASSQDAGTAEFKLVRWVADRDGDPGPENGVMPATSPVKSYRSATIAPGAGAAKAAGECTYDASGETSTRTFAVPLDNSGSTLPSTFTVRAGGRSEQVVLGAGESTTVTLQVPWGTGTGEVTADGRDVRALDVDFTSCATAPAWPTSVTASAVPVCTDGVANVDVDVTNPGSRSWRATVLRLGEVVGSRDLPAGGSASVATDRDSRWLRSGDVTVRLDRTIEGNGFSTEQTVPYDGIRCVVVDPAARLDAGEVQLDRNGDYATSWRDVDVLLDNSRSNVTVTFQVTGPNGLDRSVSVPAGSTDVVDGPRVDGRQGATFTVATRRWSTTLEVGTFTAAEAGWCGDRITWGSGYAAGDVRSWNGIAYRYAGWDGTAPDGADAEGPGARWWQDGKWNGQWRQWEKVGLCEYR